VFLERGVFFGTHFDVNVCVFELLGLVTLPDHLSFGAVGCKATPAFKGAVGDHDVAFGGEVDW
jgi:hypothetical protein